jgi:hypothetical protein
MSLLRFLAKAFGQTLWIQVCLFLATSALAADIPQAVKSEGSTSLRLRTSTGDEVTVILTQTKVGASYPYKDALMWGGDVGEPPQSILASVQILSGRETIFLPLSAYGDLGDVRSASLEKNAQGFTLSLHGGDAAAAYDATFSFSRGYLASRLVALREFPDQRREKTNYSFPARTSE